MNPWLEIPLEEYEAHMSMASVAQAQFLARVLEQRVRELRPQSVAVIGCAGGNGFESLPIEQVRRVVGIDINPQFIATTRSRFIGRFDRLELICDDIMNVGEGLEPVDFAFAGLVFEYVDYLKCLASIVRLLSPDGHLSVVLQLPGEGMADVSPTPYTSLLKLDGFLKCVPAKQFESAARSIGLTMRFSKRTALLSGKEFQEFLFQKRDNIERQYRRL